MDVDDGCIVYVLFDVNNIDNKIEYLFFRKQNQSIYDIENRQVFPIVIAIYS